MINVYKDFERIFQAITDSELPEDLMDKVLDAVNAVQWEYESESTKDGVL